MSFKDTTWILLLYFITLPAWHSLGSVITAATRNSLSFINRAVSCCVVLCNILCISASIYRDEEFHMVLVSKGGGSHKEGLLFKMQMTEPRDALNAGIVNKREENTHNNGKRSRSRKDTQLWFSTQADCTCKFISTQSVLWFSGIWWSNHDKALRLFIFLTSYNLRFYMAAVSLRIVVDVIPGLGWGRSLSECNDLYDQIKTSE